MSKKNFNFIVITVFVLLAVITFLFWFTYNPTSHFASSQPGQDNRPKIDPNQEEKVTIGDIFRFFSEKNNEDLTGKWTRFRGDKFDNIVSASQPLIDEFPSSGLNILWQHDLGEGHAGPVIYNGNVYLLDYDEVKKRDQLRCFDLVSGEEIWRRGYKVHIKRNHGMSRTVPAITDKYIVTMGPRGHVMCVNPTNGDLIWGLDLVKEYGTEIPFWYTGQCPLIDNDVAILAPGGKAILIGVDCETGKVLWETPNPDSLQMSHSSIFPMKLGNKSTYIYAAIGGMVGISAEESDKGEMLWFDRTFSPNVVAPSPLVLPDNKIYMTAGYGAGAILLEINPNDYSVNVIDQYKPKDGLASEQQTPILWNGKLFGIMPKDGGAYRNQFVCANPANPREILWSSGKADRFGLGPYIWADNKFFILNDNGTLSIVRATVNGWQLSDKQQIIEGHDAWGPLAIADGYLVLRDSKHLLCIDIRK